MILAILLAFAAFSDTTSCTIQGYVSKFNTDDTVSFTQANTCQGVKITTDDTQIVMYSPYHWVTVKIPAALGHRRFQYRFGSDVAHLGADTIPILWGMVNRG